ncbi:MAG: hypothetical protein NTV34_12460, partial [Proteobacteria bacterium]|nr:hypothetical protein [Pseudomonadota bacterium]
PEEPIDIPPCLFPGQYPYCLPIHGVAAMAEDLAENSHTPFDEVATPFYEIRNFNALDFRTAAAPSLYSCAAGSSVTPISKADLAVALTKLYVARLVISKSGRVVAENESDVTAIQCLSFKNLN